MTTPQQTHLQIQNLFSVLSDTLNDIGVLQTINILKKGKNNSVDKSDLVLASQAVAESFNIPVTALFGKSRKYPRKYAFAIWVYICYIDLKYTLSDISGYIHLSPSCISKAKQLMEKYPQDSAFNQKIHEKMAQSRERLKEKINYQNS